MNHIVLPHLLATSLSLTKLAGPGTMQLLERALGMGALRGGLRARLFGGACITEGLLGRARDLGEQNVLAVREALRSAGIRIASEDVGGARGRKVVFCTDTGASQVTLL